MPFVEILYCHYEVEFLLNASCTFLFTGSCQNISGIWGEFHSMGYNPPPKEKLVRIMFANHKISRITPFISLQFGLEYYIWYSNNDPNTH